MSVGRNEQKGKICREESWMGAYHSMRINLYPQQPVEPRGQEAIPNVMTLQQVQKEPTLRNVRMK